ncbi:hypothetical protein [Rhizobium viscosum]|uniref:Uncharacterized protein n=1 Tax=Rhizobium viscosum TaxID=1673 RepID=A0ABR9IZG5_RHIVS|nr:hypothetical protein [Rhizobium viscosum]MBE1508607.1 hypothetical protein [Rhizobium viscosum]
MTEHDGAQAHRTKAIWIWFWVLAFFSGATWITMWRLPTTGVCYFRDVWLLRSFWFQNLTMFDEITNLVYSDSQQCVLFAVRSILSLYIAVLAGVFVFLSRNADHIPPANRPVLIVVSVFLLGYLIFRDGFNDQYHGYRAGFSYRTYDSINWLIAKSIFRMICVYALVVVWGLQAVRLWHWSAVSSDNK